MQRSNLTVHCISDELGFLLLKNNKHIISLEKVSGFEAGNIAFWLLPWPKPWINEGTCAQLIYPRCHIYKCQYYLQHQCTFTLGIRLSPQSHMNCEDSLKIPHTYKIAKWSFSFVSPLLLPPQPWGLILMWYANFYFHHRWQLFWLRRQKYPLLYDRDHSSLH